MWYLTFLEIALVLQELFSPPSPSVTCADRIWPQDGNACMEPDRGAAVLLRGAG